MDDFLTKPIRVDALREAIGRWARRSADAASAPEPGASTAA
jgi:hypothetical protein